jgi:L-aminopeptidase/D-esterase-like protein
VAGAEGNLLAVRGLRVGHATDPDGATGVTAVLFDDGAPTVVDVRGGASGTYDTASLSLDSTFGRRWALFVAGGSLYGLDAARGIRTSLLEHGGGFRVFGHRRPVVPLSGGVIFDLPAHDRPLPDYGALGYAAAEAAGRGSLPQGRVGAGAGATVAKYLGRDRGAPGGLGSSARAVSGGRSVGVLTVVNAAGAVRDPSTGAWAAAARGRSGTPTPPEAVPRRRLGGRGTTVTVVATDLPLGRPALARVAAIVHAGLARTIVPYLTSVDGDLVFAATTAPDGPAPREPWPGAAADQVGRLAADAAVEAVLAAVGRGLRREKGKGPRTPSRSRRS